MKHESLLQRLREIPEEMHMNWNEICVYMGIPRQTLFQLQKRLQEGKTAYFDTVEKLGQSLRYIPVVFFYAEREEGTSKEVFRPETLGQKGFLQGRRIQNYVGKVIRHYREEAELTVMQLSELSGVNANNIGYYERGTKNPRINCLESVAAAFDLRIRYLMQPEQDAELLTSLQWAQQRLEIGLENSVDLQQAEEVLMHLRNIRDLEQKWKKYYPMLVIPDNDQ